MAFACSAVRATPPIGTPLFKMPSSARFIRACTSGSSTCPRLLMEGARSPGPITATSMPGVAMITIEHADAVERIDEIMATPGIDVAVIGPGDLATSINKRGQVDDPEVQALMKRAEEGILKSGVPIGGVARTAEQANAMIDRGYLALALGFDWSLFQRGIAAAFQGIKR